MKILAILAAAALSTSTFAADQKMDPKKDAMMKKWMEYSTPSAPHKELAPLQGEWTYTSTMWETPAAKPMTSTGKTQFEMVLGNRFLQQKFTGEAMGEKFEGIGFVGYNNLEKRYESIWLDSMGTGIMAGNGPMDSKTKTIKETGEFSCPFSDDKTRAFRSEWKMIDKNNMKWTLYSPDIETGKEFKNMEIVYKR